MLGLVLPTMFAILGVIFGAYRIRDLSASSMFLLAVCLAPQAMHLVAWDTTRIWTYSILSSFLALWVYSETVPAASAPSQFVRLVALLAIVLNVVELTPLMDGLHDRLELTTRILCYAPVIAAALELMLRGEPRSIAAGPRTNHQSAAI